MDALISTPAHFFSHFRSVCVKAGFLGAYLYSGMAFTACALISIFLLLGPFPVRGRERVTRRLIHQACAGLVIYLKFFHLLETDFTALATLRKRRGVIIAVNHPTYIDAIFMMSQLPQMFCLVKASLQRNPCLAAIVRCAGYEDNSDSHRLLENCARRLQAGENLLVFPEGTRTSTPPLGQLKRGFALMALRARAPVITVLIASCNGPYLRKGQPFFAFPPRLPLGYRFTLGQEFSGTAAEPSREFCQKIEAHFRSALPGQA